ncbi:hypothetical protein [Mesorhizobium sp. C399B]|uniref:hypothetical protein n=1 Tax=unclassified Mesorhizobium TaxID=325217 RepID=UPI0025776F20|nr:hypothetical protein [Mesorhizobium sp. C399B]WJI72388.1 hypothetical protein NLY36_26010 [Mesorhizobium sp. C399B]
MGKSVALTLLGDEFAGEGTALRCTLSASSGRRELFRPSHTTPRAGDAAMRSFGHGR